MTAIVAALTVVVALLTVLVAGLLRSHAEILRRLHELGAGLDSGADAPGGGIPTGRAAPSRPATTAAAPDVAGRGVSADALSIRLAGRPHRTLLAFLSSGCTTCRAFWDAFAHPGTLGLPDDLRLVVVTQDEGRESPSAVAELAGDATVVMSSQAWDDYRVPGSPYFVLVTDDRISGEGTGVSWEQVRRLLGEATGDAELLAAANGRSIDLTDGAHDREARIDRALLASGIHPGHPSLYHPARGAAPGGGA
jgi:hypothetical protein